MKHEKDEAPLVARRLVKHGIAGVDLDAQSEHKTDHQNLYRSERDR